jgi:hypothetical protein
MPATWITSVTVLAHAAEMPPIPSGEVSGPSSTLFDWKSAAAVSAADGGRGFAAARLRWLGVVLV